MVLRNGANGFISEATVRRETPYVSSRTEKIIFRQYMKTPSIANNVNTESVAFSAQYHEPAAKFSKFFKYLHVGKPHNSVRKLVLKWLKPVGEYLLPASK